MYMYVTKIPYVSSSPRLPLGQGPDFDNVAGARASIMQVQVLAQAELSVEACPFMLLAVPSNSHDCSAASVSCSVALCSSDLFVLTDPFCYTCQIVITH